LDIGISLRHSVLISNVILCLNNLSFLSSVSEGAPILGGFTTYSSFAFETITMLKQQLFKQAFAYILLTNLVCIGFAYLGFSIKS
jgi:fluoride ion exporter CrcB/FEX